MSEKSFFALHSKRVVTPDGLRESAIVIRDGTISYVGSKQGVPSECHVTDLGNLVILPGLVDTHVHINEPGRTEWEGFETATKAAAAGGITTLVDMPLNSSPVTTTVSSFKTKLKAAERKLFVDCGFYAGLIPGNIGDLPGLIDEGVLGVKAFLVHSGIDEFPNATVSDLQNAMPLLTQKSLPLLVHAELADDLPAAHGDAASYQRYLNSRPRRWENQAIEMMIALCNEFKTPVHIVHLSSSDALKAIQHARASGLRLTVETCPHYLYFSSEQISDGDTRFKCAPPIRENENREKLWQALKDGLLDMIVSDHSPCPPEMKKLQEGDFVHAWGGIASLQLGLPVVWTEAARRGFSLTDIARWMSYEPAKLVGLHNKKGAVAAGYDADLVVFDPEGSFAVQGSQLFHRHKVTPYEGSTLKGHVLKTYLRGRKIFDAGKIVSGPIGRPLFRK